MNRIILVFGVFFATTTAFAVNAQTTNGPTASTINSNANSAGGAPMPLSDTAPGGLNNTPGTISNPDVRNPLSSYSNPPAGNLGQTGRIHIFSVAPGVSPYPGQQLGTGTYSGLPGFLYGGSTQGSSTLGSSTPNGNTDTDVRTPAAPLSDTETNRGGFSQTPGR